MEGPSLAYVFIIPYFLYTCCKCEWIWYLIAPEKGEKQESFQRKVERVERQLIFHYALQLQYTEIKVLISFAYEIEYFTTHFQLLLLSTAPSAISIEKKNFTDFFFKYFFAKLNPQVN